MKQQCNKKIQLAQYMFQRKNIPKTVVNIKFPKTLWISWPAKQLLAYSCRRSCTMEEFLSNRFILFLVPFYLYWGPQISLRSS